MKTIRSNLTALGTSAACWGILGCLVLMAVPHGFPEEPKTLRASRADIPPKLDGKLDERCWESAEKTVGFSNSSEPAVMAKDQTVCRVVFDDNYLYVGIECLESRMDLLRKDLASLGDQFDYGVAEVVELFLDPGLSKRFYSQFMIGANGAHVSNHSDPLQIAALPYEAAVSMGPDRFFVEVAIPFAILHLGPDTKPIWGFNVNRARSIERESRKGPNDNWYSSWQNTGGAFNRPSRFGQLRLDLNTSNYWYQVRTLAAPPDTLEKAQFRVSNRTGGAAEIRTRLGFKTSSGKEKSYRQSESIPSGAEKLLEFAGPFPDWTRNAVLTLEIQDSKTSRVLYQGATRSVDITPQPQSNPKYSKADVDRGYVAFAKDYNSILLRTYLPAAEEVDQPLEIYASPGEYEPCILGIRTLNAALKGVKVGIPDDPTAPNGARISRDNLALRIGTDIKYWTPNGQGQEFRWQPWLVEKELPSELSPHRAYAYWITLKVPKDAVPGTYSAKVQFSADGVPPRQIPLKVTIWPIRLQTPAQMCWGYYYDVTRLPPSARTLEYQARIFRDMVEYGMNNVTIYGGVTSDGKIDQPCDPYLPFCQTMNDALAAGAISPGVPVVTLGVPIQSKAVEEARIQNQWPPLLLFACDEPDDEERIAAAKKILTEIKKNNPGVKTVTAISERGLEALGDLYDAWTVGAGALASPVVKKGRASGAKLIWGYDCSDFVYNLPSSRYLSGLFSWRSGINGFWQWGYVDRQFEYRSGRPLSEVFSNEPDALWPFYLDNRDDCNPRFNWVFPAKDELVPSVGHIGRREGVDDYRYLYTLKQLIDAASSLKTGAAEKAAARANDLLRSIVDRVSDNPWRKETYPYEAMKKAGRVVELGDWQPDQQIALEDYNRFRRQIALQIIELQSIVQGTAGNQS